jgi:hypothetical protein
MLSQGAVRLLAVMRNKGMDVGEGEAEEEMERENTRWWG